MKDWPLFYAPEVKEQLALPEAEAQHALRVLRVRPGDELLATDGRGALYELRVTATDRRHCLVELTHEERWQPYWRGRLTLALAPTKSMERIEWTLEKAVELGVDELILLRVKHSERKHTNIARLERIIESAMKQSHKAWLPEWMYPSPSSWRSIPRPSSSSPTAVGSCSPSVGSSPTAGRQGRTRWWL